MDFIIAVLRGTAGLVVLVAIAYAASQNRKHIDWMLVLKGIAFQIAIALLVLKVGFVATFFDLISRAFVKLISFTQYGTEFLFSSFVTGKIEPGVVSFAFNILPTIVFFSAITAMLYYFGVLQKVVYAFAWVMKKLMNLSGAESLAAAGNIFLGQTESPLLVKPYLQNMTKSEVMCLMTGGMATIAGGVLAAYMQYLGGDDPAQQVLFAKHLLTASVMSAPAAVVAAKILVPEREPINQSMEISDTNFGDNVLEAISNGTSDGLRLAVNVGAMLLVFTALIYLGNYIFKDIIGHYSGINTWISDHTAYDGLSLQFILGYLFAPVAWIMGVPGEDAVLVGQLLGEKTILNEFYAYATLGSMKAESVLVHEKSIIMATYILCGFANFASIGIQIGGIGALAPSQKVMLSRLGLYALLGGTLACLFTASIVGMFIP
ncbi:MAG: nucleoside transporter C-terminal domain-containing protein [Salibacteraceae bacterium]